MIGKTLGYNRVNCHNANCVIAVILFFSVTGSYISFGTVKKLNPEELVAKHIKSIGSPEVLERIQTREIMGTSTFHRVLGGFGKHSGIAQIASDGRKLGIVIRYNNPDYPGEHFAFDGIDVTIGRFIPGKISPLAEFINRFDDIMKAGLLGGALSTAWPLLNIRETQPRLEYKKAKLTGRLMHALEYRPKRGLGDLETVLFFEPETFHHIRTEYKLYSFDPGDHTVLSEDFADFKEVDGMMLPQRYTISFSTEGFVTRTYLANWIFDAKQWAHNGKIDSRIFRAAE
jgi:hypothetical protein